MVQSLVNCLFERGGGELLKYSDFCPCRIHLLLQHQMSPKLQEAMEGLISVFHSYSANEGDKYKLSKAELKTLLQGELACLLAVSQ